MHTAIFDLDGTITRHDTPDRLHRRVPRRHGPLGLLRFVRTLPALAMFAVHRDRGRLKSAVIRATLGGAPRGELAAWTLVFVDRLLRAGVHEQALQAIAQHRRSGDALILLSASPDLYVPEIAARLGFSQTICTGVRWHCERLEGSLTTPEPARREGAVCHRAARAGPAWYSRGLWQCSERHSAFAPGGSRCAGQRRGDLRKLAENAGIECVDWS